MKTQLATLHSRLQAKYNEGKIGWALLWLMGVPLPVLLIIYVLTGHH